MNYIKHPSQWKYNTKLHQIKLETYRDTIVYSVHSVNGHDSSPVIVLSHFHWYGDCNNHSTGYIAGLSLYDEPMTPSSFLVASLFILLNDTSILDLPSITISIFPYFLINKKEGRVRAV